eukprot:symbB.v1.2.005762.t1/scaffold289.1/size287290/7
MGLDLAIGEADGKPQLIVASASEDKSCRVFVVALWTAGVEAEAVLCCGACAEGMRLWVGDSKCNEPCGWLWRIWFNHANCSIWSPIPCFAGDWCWLRSTSRISEGYFNTACKSWRSVRASAGMSFTITYASMRTSNPHRAKSAKCTN